MSDATTVGNAAVTVVLDVRHPLAALALGPTLAFGQERGVGIDWLPLAVPTLRPPSEPGPDDDRGTRHRRKRAQAIAREIETYAAVQGMVLRDPYRNGPADAAHCAWLWVRERAPDRLEHFLHALFHAYWAGGLDASEPEDVARLVDASQADAAGFATWAARDGAAALAAAEDALRARGVSQVPAYLVEDEIFVGRQHLPMIAWILGGRRGPGPI